MANGSPEHLMVKLWQSQLPGRTDLVTEAGAPIRIIYPGRINDDQGADLRDAVLATRQGLVKGDIEFHVKSSSWQAHGHHQHPTYNRVILHVVMWRDTELTTRLQNGQKVPILALHQYLKSPNSLRSNLTYSLTASNLPCSQVIKHLPTSTITEFLDSAGKERFFTKATGFQDDLRQTEASQTLYQGIMVALGYAKNRRPFLELARRLPLPKLESMTQSDLPAEDGLARQEAMLLGTAGLLPSQRLSCDPQNNGDDLWVEKLEKLWAVSGETEVMSEDDWQLFKVRPNNSPLRRIAAMSHLILRYQTKGVFAEVMDQMRQTTLDQGYFALERIWLVTSDGYWASHFDFGSSCRLRTSALLGRHRAAEIVVNVLLPFAFAWGKATTQTELAKKSFALYGHYPRLGTNVIERHMRQQLGLNSNLVNSARRQQGLIHIYRTLCSQGECHHCPFGENDSAGHSCFISGLPPEQDSEFGGSQ